MVFKKSLATEVTMTKPLSNAEVIAEDPIKHVLTVIEKKVRNMEKRKVKLDGYRKIVLAGGVLDPDQDAAVKKYDEVVGSLEFAKESLKSFSSLSNDIFKANKKKKQQELIRREEADLQLCQFTSRALEIFKIISTNDKVQKDFLEGHNGAVALSENDLNQILEFYKTCLIASHDTGSDVYSNVDSVGKNLYLLHEASHKTICGTTYSDMNGILQKVSSSQYFSDMPEMEEPEEAEEELEENEESVEEEEDESVASADDNEEYKDCDDIENENEDDGTDDPEPDGTADVIAEVQPEESLQTADFVASEVECHSQNGNYAQPKLQIAFSVEESSKTVVTAQPKANTVRSIKEVLAEVQGEYSFLQDSMIDFEVSTNTNPPPQESTFSLPQVSQHAVVESPLVPGNGSIQYSRISPPVINHVDVDHATMASTQPIAVNQSHMTKPGPYSSIPPAVNALAPQSDSLGMGQTTFGNNHNSFNAPISKQVAENIYPPTNYMHPDLHTQPKQTFSATLNSVDTTSIAVPLQMTAPAGQQLPSMLPSSINVPDPPKAHIPLPNEEITYKSYSSNINTTQDIGRLSETVTTNSQDDAASLKYSLMHQHQTPSHVSGDLAQMNGDDQQVMVSSTADNNSCHTTEDIDHIPSAMAEDADQSLSAGAKGDMDDSLTVQIDDNCGNAGKGDQVSSDPNQRLNNRNSGYHNGNQYNKANAVGRNQNSQQMHSYFSRGGGGNNNYRQQNTQRNYNQNFDSMGHPRNFGAGYQSIPPYSQYSNRQQDSGMFTGMRRGNPGAGRGGRGSGSSRNMRPGSYNRSRTFRPQGSEQAF